jgi:hypothetical protein
MSIQLLFWVLYVVALVFGFTASPPAAGWRPLGDRILWFVLVGLLGWEVFGAAVHR